MSSAVARSDLFNLDLDSVHHCPAQLNKMKFVSTAEPNIRSADELLVFCYGEERVLLPLPPTFSVRPLVQAFPDATLDRVCPQEAQRVARDTFGIEVENGLVLETTDLLGCADVGPVQITEAAWPGVSPVLPKVFVRKVARHGESSAYCTHFVR